MANNVLTVADQDDEFEDWIELYNNSSYDISTDGMFLSDDASDIGKWTMPSTIIEPGEYFTIWADGDTMQTGNHANFEFNGEGDSLWISYSDGSIIDSVYFGEQQTISSFGRYPNGTGSFVEMLPTFGKENDGVDASVLLEDVFVYPNPADGELNVRINQSESCEIAIYTLDGRMAAPKQKSVGGETIAINTFSFSRGIYLLHVSYGSENTIKKIMITH